MYTRAHQMEILIENLLNTICTTAAPPPPPSPPTTTTMWKKDRRNKDYDNWISVYVESKIKKRGKKSSTNKNTNEKQKKEEEEKKRQQHTHNHTHMNVKWANSDQSQNDKTSWNGKIRQTHTVIGKQRKTEGEKKNTIKKKHTISI